MFCILRRCRISFALSEDGIPSSAGIGNRGMPSEWKKREEEEKGLEGEVARATPEIQSNSRGCITCWDTLAEISGENRGDFAAIYKIACVVSNKRGLLTIVAIDWLIGLFFFFFVTRDWKEKLISLIFSLLELGFFYRTVNYQINCN